MTGYEWERRAACRDEDPELCWPLPRAYRQIRVAKEMCQNRCPVAADCLKDAIDNGEVFGVRGWVHGGGTVPDGTRTQADSVYPVPVVVRAGVPQLAHGMPRLPSGRRDSRWRVGGGCVSTVLFELLPVTDRAHADDAVRVELGVDHAYVLAQLRIRHLEDENRHLRDLVETQRFQLAGLGAGQ